MTTTQKVIRLSVFALSTAAGIAIMISLFNMPAGNNGEPLFSVSANFSGDSVIKENQANNIVAYIAPPEVKKPPIPDKKDLIASRVKTVPAEVESSSSQPLTDDSSLVVTEIRTTGIEKIGFIRDLNLKETEFSGTLIAINTINEFPVETTDRPGFNDFIAKAFRDRILKSGTPETGSLKVYEIADAGINGLNKLLGWDMSLQKTRDEKGALKSLYFSSKILKFNAPVKKVQLEP